MNRLINKIYSLKDVFVPEWIMVRKELSPGEKLCYASLLTIANQTTDVSRQRIANFMGTSIRQVDRYIKRLRELKLIKVEKQGLQKPNQYYFYRHKWMNDER